MTIASRSTDESAAKRRRLELTSSIVLFAALTGLSLYVAYAAMFTRFYAYDDEGFHLISLRSSMGEGELYENVFAQYGPFHYQVMGLVFRLLGTLPTHDTGRLVTLTLWIATSLLVGVAMFQFTRNLLMGLSVQVMVFLMLGSLPNEPMHPGGLLVFLLAVLVAVAVLVVPRHTTIGMFLVGALVSCIFLTKVNVGGFAVISAVFASTVLFPVLAKRPTIRFLAGLAMVAAPSILMFRDFDQPWAWRFAVLVSLSALSLVVASTWLRPSTRLSFRVLWWLIAGMVTPAVVVPAVVILQGTSLRAFFDGFLINPLSQPDVFSLFPRPPAWALAPAVLSVFLAFVAARRARSGRLNGLLSGVVAMGGGLVMWLALMGPLPMSRYAFWLALPISWLVLLTAPSKHGEIAYLLIPSVGVLQSLHMYPVAGSQVSWATFLLIPVGAMAISGGYRLVVAAVGFGRLGPRARMTVLGAPVLALLVWVVASAFPSLKGMVDAERTYPPLDLPGARRLQFSPDLISDLRGVTEGLRENCSTFISLPGLNSFYIFAEQDPPTGLNQSGWMYVFDADIQRRIVQQVSGISDLCLLRNRDVTAFWRQGRPLPRRPLVTFMEESFTPFRSWGPYELLLRTPGPAIEGSGA